MCASTFDKIPAKQTPFDNGEARKLARIAQLEADIARLKSIWKQREIGSIAYDREAGEAALQRFVEWNMLPMHRADIYGHVYEINDAMEQLLGYSKDDWMSGKIRWDEITPPEYLHTDDRAIEQLKECGFAAPWEKEYICKDGTRKSVLVCVTSADKTGNDCFTIVVDRTKQRRLAAEILKSEEKFRLLAEAIPNIVWMAQPSGLTTYHNKRYYEYLGINSNDDDGWAWFQCVHPDDQELFMKRVEEARENKSSFEFEYRYRSKEGIYKWHLCRGLPLTDEAGSLVMFFGTCTNIDSPKQMEEELRESELRFRTLANAIPQIVWTAETNGTIDFFNDRWFEYTGLSTEQSCDEGWQLLIHPDDLESYRGGWREALETGDSYETEFRLKRAVGIDTNGQQYRWHLCRAVALHDAKGQVTKWFATWTEIDGQKNKRESGQRPV